MGEQDKNERYCCSMVIWVSCSSLSTLIWSFRIRNQNLKIFFISAVRIFQNLFLIVWPTFSVGKKVLRFQFWAHQSSGRLCFRSIGVLRSIFWFFSKKRKHSELSFLSCSPTCIVARPLSCPHVWTVATVFALQRWLVSMACLFDFHPRCVWCEQDICRSWHLLL